MIPNIINDKMIQNRNNLEVRRMKKICTLLVLVTLFISLIPGIALAGGGVPSGLTLQAWVVGPNQSGKGTSIGFKYSGGFSTNLFLSIPFDSSWKKVDPIEPILEAYKEGYGSGPEGLGDIFKSSINFAPNVLAAMKVQNFNPSQVGGADIPPSSTTLNSDQTAWLQKIGYSVPSTSQDSTSTPTDKESTTTSTTAQTESQPQPKPSKQSSATSTGKANTSDPVQSDPAIGQTVKTPTDPITPETVAAAKKWAEENPPSLNPANIPTKLPIKEETKAQKNIWIWVTAGVSILVLAAVAGRIIYVRHRVAERT